MNSSTNSNEIYINYDFNNSLLPNTWDQLLIDSGTSIVSNDGYVAMSTPNIGGRVIRQSKEYFSAKSYKFNTVIFTAVLNTTTEALPVGRVSARSRIGIFDDRNDKTNETTDSGFFFEYKITDQLSSTLPILNPLYVGIRYNSISNLRGDTLISQDNFNGNKLNQNSQTRITSWSKIYTFEIKYNTIGYVEWSIYLDGERMVLHREQDISSILNILPNFSIPIRFEIDNRNIANGGINNEITPINNNSMRQFHASILYESGSVSNYETGINVPSSDIRNFANMSDILFNFDNVNYDVVFSFRLKQEYIRKTIKLYEILYLATRKGPFTYEILRNAAPVDATWIDPGPEYWLEYSTNSIDVSNSDSIIYKQLIDTTDGASGIPSIIHSYPPIISSNIQGTSDILTVRAKKLSQNKVSVNLDLRWVQN